MDKVTVYPQGDGQVHPQSTLKIFCSRWLAHDVNYKFMCLSVY